MTVLGIMMFISGIICCAYGYSLNNDADAQMEAFFGHGRTNPGDDYIVPGIGLCVLGVILIIIGLALKFRQNDSSGSKRHCIKCGALLYNGADFCSKCGAKQIQNRKVCPNCGAEVAVYDALCNRCGTHISTSYSATALPVAYCPHCGEGLRYNSKKCPYCGREIDYAPPDTTQGTWKCKKCGKINKNAIMICMDCGNIR